MAKFLSKIQILPKNPNLAKKSKFCQKIEILPKIATFTEISTFLEKIQILPKIEILLKNPNLIKKNLPKNRTFAKKSLFCWNIDIFRKNPILRKKFKFTNKNLNFAKKSWQKPIHFFSKIEVFVKKIKIQILISKSSENRTFFVFFWIFFRIFPQKIKLPNYGLKSHNKRMSSKQFLTSKDKY